MPPIGAMSLYYQGLPPVDRAPNMGVLKAPGGGGIDPSGCQDSKNCSPTPKRGKHSRRVLGFPLLSPLPLVHPPNLAPLALNLQILGLEAER